MWLSSTVLALLIGAGAPTQPDSGVHIRFNGDIGIPTGERNAAVFVVNGSARIQGAVRAVVVIAGDVIVSGGHVGDLTVVRGRATLSDSAVVSGDVHLVDATLSQGGGSRVEGAVERTVGRRLMADLAGVTALFGLGVVIAFVLAAVIAAAVVPRAVRHAGELIVREPGRTTMTVLLLWLAFPLAAALLSATVVFTPVAVGFFVFVLPTLWFLGLIVGGTKLGDLLLGRMRGRIEATRPYLAALLGVGGLLLVSRIPLLGVLLPVAALAGSGAILLTAWRHGRGAI